MTISPFARFSEMERRAWKLAALLAAAICLASVSGVLTPPERTYRRWLAANTRTEAGVAVTIVRTAEKAKPDGSISTLPSLDAALFIRAMARHKPRLIVIAGPITDDANTPLLEGVIQSNALDAQSISFCGGVLEAIHLPAVRAAESVPPSPSVTAFVPRGYFAGAPTAGGRGLVSRSGSNAVASAPIAALLAYDRAGHGAISGSAPGELYLGGRVLAPLAADGSSILNPSAAGFVETMAFEDLLMRTEKSEQGIISPGLAAAFRDRVAVLTSESPDSGAMVAALINRLYEGKAPEWTLFLFAAALAMLWMTSLPRRWLLMGAAALLAAWFMMAVAIYHDFRLAMPAAAPILLSALFAAIELTPVRHARP